jgi:hypothetical protein
MYILNDLAEMEVTWTFFVIMEAIKDCKGFFMDESSCLVPEG